MKYRKLPHGEEQISIIGMGSSVIGEQAEKDIIKTVHFAMDAGINYFDMAGGHASIFSGIWESFRRPKKRGNAASTFWSKLYNRRIRMDDESEYSEKIH